LGDHVTWCVWHARKSEHVWGASPLSD
jgi:hypothetical protein